MKVYNDSQRPGHNPEILLSSYATAYKNITDDSKISAHLHYRIQEEIHWSLVIRISTWSVVRTREREIDQRVPEVHSK